MMFIDMLIKTWPRSWRAAAALLALFVGTGILFDGLQALLLPDQPGGGFKFFAGLAIALPAVIAFYHYQFMDGGGRTFNQLETLDKAYGAQLQEQRIRRSTATPVFSSHHGEHVAHKPHQAKPHAHDGGPKA